MLRLTSIIAGFVILLLGGRKVQISGPYFFGISTNSEETMSRLDDYPKVRIIRMQKEKITVILSGVNEKVSQELEKSGFYE